MDEPPAFEPQDAVGKAVSATMVMGLAGFTVSAIQNALTKQNVGAWGVFSRSGRIITLFVSTGATFAFSKAAAGNLREKDDSWNATIGGFLAGAVGGLHMRTMPAVLGCGAAFAAMQGAFHFTGNKMTGFDKDPNIDEFTRKEQLRQQRRRPVSEIIEQLGPQKSPMAPDVPALDNRRSGDAFAVVDTSRTS